MSSFIEFDLATNLLRHHGKTVLDFQSLYFPKAQLFTIFDKGIP